jgi:hypothetical protein
VAGQSKSGGWGYHCPILKSEEEGKLHLALQKVQPASPLDLFVPINKSSSDPAVGISKTAPDAKPTTGAKDPEAVPKASLPEALRKVPALEPPARSHVMPRHDLGTFVNNSTTQFAVLGLWAARRHQLPLERALALVVQRFRVSQAPGGSWSYDGANKPSAWNTPSMTGAGLLGLAVGHGLTADSLSDAARAELARDPDIQKGLLFLSESIGKPLGKAAGSVAINLYFLWTVERVGVLYNLPSIHGKEWYPWGASEILAQQEEDGSWNCGGYGGAIPVTDTCFALLFLQRANLAKDLSKKLEFFTVEKKLNNQ